MTKNWEDYGAVLTIEEVADILHCNRETVMVWSRYNWGPLYGIGVKYGINWLYPKDSIMKLFEPHEQDLSVSLCDDLLDLCRERDENLAAEFQDMAFLALDNKQNLIVSFEVSVKNNRVSLQPVNILIDY